MSKLSLIIKREYLTRVTKKSFIIGTLLAPLGLLVYMLVIVGLTKYESGGEIKVAVLDEAGVIKQMPDDKGIRFIPTSGKTLEQLKTEVQNKQFDGVLQIPPLGSFNKKEYTVFYHSDDRLAPEKSSVIERKVGKKIRDFKIDSLKLDPQALDMLETKVAIDPEKITGSGDDDSKYTAGVGLVIGGIMAFIMFFMVTMYGAMVMRSVMEEKTNRIVEVMMSSVRPFELMLGKIIGAGAVGLTQVLIWVVLGGGVMLLVPLFMGGIDPSQMQGAMPAPGEMPTIDPEEIEGETFRFMTEIGKQNWPLIIFSFIVFFLGGYFIYSSLFAAIGSAIGDDLGEGQSLTLPVMIPIILAFYITAFAGMRNPNSGLMVFASMFPLFSPIVMPFRMAFSPPIWQIILSLALVVAAAFFFVWLAGRIYRVGILLYGKKVTFKEIGKWMFYKG
ncbi:MAG: ABC transporter permease [Saprospiraceae bacterium]|nr:ABC transporter permease [Saprospiraceae bacterium]